MVSNRTRPATSLTVDQASHGWSATVPSGVQVVSPYGVGHGLDGGDLPAVVQADGFAGLVVGGDLSDPAGQGLAGHVAVAS